MRALAIVIFLLLWFIYVMLAPSIGLMAQIQQYTSTAGTSKGRGDGNVFYPRGMGRAAIGFNSKKWYCSIGLLVDSYIINLPDIGNASVNVGYRFNVPKKFKKLSRTIDNYAPEKILEEITH
jgi:hypothetical protein